MKKEEFIKKITSMDKNQIREFIEKNGKKPKLIPMVVSIKKE